MSPNKIIINSKLLIIVELAIIIILAIYYYFSCQELIIKGKTLEWPEPERFILNNTTGEKLTFNRLMPLIFIGGMPRSGTTLLRVMLDAHPDIRCGEETRVVPRMLGHRMRWVEDFAEMNRLQESGVSTDVLNHAFGAFVLEIIARHSYSAPRLCNKDPFTLRSAAYLRSYFPNSKFVFMIRDGRAVVHSMITRKVSVAGFNSSDVRQCLDKWSEKMFLMNRQCQTLGSKVCLHVFYEQLVLQPEKWLRKILEFLEVPWNDAVLHHENLVNRKDVIFLSKLALSNDQVIKPINTEALSKWVGFYPQDVIRDMYRLAPMLEVFGYDPFANPPDYGKPDSMVQRNMDEMKKNEKKWNERVGQLLKEKQAIRKKIFDQLSEESKKYYHY